MVPESITEDDVSALLEFGILESKDFRAHEHSSEISQRRMLETIVKRVHQRIGRFDPLPIGARREPRDVLEAGSGVCFDRARLIEKAVRATGMNTRRVFLLYGGWRNLLLPGTPTHALVEVETPKGWVFLGTLSPVTGYADDESVWNVSRLLSNITTGSDIVKRQRWNEILSTEFVPLYGVYSRHGGHYPPYTPMPDYSPSQIWDAMIE